MKQKESQNIIYFFIKVVRKLCSQFQDYVVIFFGFTSYKDITGFHLPDFVNKFYSEYLCVYFNEWYLFRITLHRCIRDNER